MPAHSETSASGWTTVSHPRGCSTCATGVSPATSNTLPRATDKSAPRVGQIWCIEESIFSPVANLLGQTMPAIMAASVTSFTDDRASKPRPCLIYQVASNNDSYLVYMFGTFNGGRIQHLPKALQFFLAQVDPQASASRRKDYTHRPLPCMHASPTWRHHPQFLVALPHWTLSGYGPKYRRQLNHIDSVWTHCDDCEHAKWKKNDDCPTFEFSETQRQALKALNVRKVRQWQGKSDAEMESMTTEFQICLDAKIGARARDNESMRSLTTIATDFASERTRLSGDRIEPALPPISEEPVPVEAAQSLARKPSLTDSSSGESEPEPETPAMSAAELPQPLIHGLDRLSLDSPATALATDASQYELHDVPTPKHKSFNRPRSPTGSKRSKKIAFGMNRLIQDAIQSATGKAPSERQMAKGTQSPSSPTTPTASGWPRPRKGSRASRAGSTRGV